MSYRIKTLEEDEWKIVSPEKDLWTSVLSRAALDALRGPTSIERDQACSFFLKGGPHFKNVCQFAGRDPDYVQGKMRKYILREEGLNADMPALAYHRKRANKTYKKCGRPRVKNIRPV